MKNDRMPRWDKLDNTALLFPVIAGETMTNVYRISIVLNENIDGEKLQEALEKVIDKFPGFKVRLRAGFFWYYFEENFKEMPKIEEEEGIPCAFINQHTNNNYLFRVSYYKTRINLEVFHVLTDGMGSINFLKELTCQYLARMHPELGTGEKYLTHFSLDREDSFRKNYKMPAKRRYKQEKAWHIHGEHLALNEIGIIHGIVSLQALKKVCKKYETSINAYLTAVYIDSICKESFQAPKKSKPVRVAVPVNLRPFFESQTNKNFFAMVSAEYQPDQEQTVFLDVLKAVKASLNEQITKENLEAILAYNVSNEKNLVTSSVPLFIKNLAIRMVYSTSAMANTSTLTNIGKIEVDDQYKPYIKECHGLLAMSKGQLIKGLICAYEDRLAITFSSVFADAGIQKQFFRQLARDGLEVEIETNGVYYDNM